MRNELTRLELTGHQINRKDFGMRFDMMLDGKFIVSNDVQINIEGELLEAQESETAGAATG